MYKKFLLLFLFFNVLICSSCSEKNILQGIYFKNITIAGSENYTVSVVKLNDNSLKNLYTDILVKTNSDNLNFTLTFENKEPLNLFISQSYQFVSLTNLINSQTDYVLRYDKFDDFLNKTFIINSTQDATFTFKAVVGNLSEDILKDQNDISNEFKISVKKTIK